MGVVNGLKGFGLGLAADMLCGGVTMGMGSLLGGLYGLFTPDAKGMRDAYEPERFSTAPRKYGSLGMFSDLFGNTRGSPYDRKNMRSEDKPKTGSLWKTVGAATIGIGLLTGGLGNFALPLFFSGLAPYNAGALVPLAWSSGMIPPGAWGWTAGFLT